MNQSFATTRAGLGDLRPALSRYDDLATVSKDPCRIAGSIDDGPAPSLIFMTAGTAVAYFEPYV